MDAIIFNNLSDLNKIFESLIFMPTKPFLCCTSNSERNNSFWVIECRPKCHGRDLLFRVITNLRKTPTEATFLINRKGSLLLQDNGRHSTTDHVTDDCKVRLGNFASFIKFFGCFQQIYVAENIYKLERNFINWFSWSLTFYKKSINSLIIYNIIYSLVIIVISIM